jgi:hypothetical protein
MILLNIEMAEPALEDKIIHGAVAGLLNAI